MPGSLPGPRLGQGGREGAPNTRLYLSPAPRGLEPRRTSRGCTEKEERGRRAGGWVETEKGGPARACRGEERGDGEKANKRGEPERAQRKDLWEEGRAGSRRGGGGRNRWLGPVCGPPPPPPRKRAREGDRAGGLRDVSCWHPPHFRPGGSRQPRTPAAGVLGSPRAPRALAASSPREARAARYPPRAPAASNRTAIRASPARSRSPTPHSPGCTPAAPRQEGPAPLGPRAQNVTQRFRCAAASLGFTSPAAGLGERGPQPRDGSLASLCLGAGAQQCPHTCPPSRRGGSFGVGGRFSHSSINSGVLTENLL